MFCLVPVVEVTSIAQAFWCPLPAAPWPTHVQLSGASSDDDVALVLLQLAVCNRAASADELARSESFILPGGLAVRDGDREILPSCCSGLEQWVEWRLALTHDVSPWMGHDPTPGIAFDEDGGHVWPDGEGSPSDRQRLAIAFRRKELAKQLVEVQRQLEAFAWRIEAVMLRHLPDQAQGLAEAFRRNFGCPAV